MTNLARRLGDDLPHERRVPDRRHTITLEVQLEGPRPADLRPLGPEHRDGLPVPAKPDSDGRRRALGFGSRPLAVASSSSVLGREVDLIDYGGLKPRLDDDIPREAVLL